jgi:molecular chaperone HtpG
LEQDLTDVTFARIDSDTIDKLIAKDEEIPSKLSKEEEEKLKPVIEGVVNKQTYTVQFESLSEQDAPIQITQSEFMRRMMEMQKVGGQGGMMGNFPDSYNLIVNSNHPLVGKILKEDNEEAQQKLAKQTADLALLSVGLLKGKELTDFVNRSLEIIE